MKDPDFFLRKTKQSISAERLTRYESVLNAPSESKLVVLGRYFWNMGLCEALYPSLQTLEVALRNSIHQAASALFQNELWLDVDYRVVLPDDAPTVEQAKTRQVNQRKQITPGALVSELNFGFWTSLFDSRYEQVLWTKIVRDVFPFVEKRHRHRRHLAEVMHGIRKLRNRAFHHESIWNRPHLLDVHQQIIDAIGWISPALAEIACRVDRFPKLFVAGPARYQEILSDIAETFDTGVYPQAVCEQEERD